MRHFPANRYLTTRVIRNWQRGRREYVIKSIFVARSNFAKSRKGDTFYNQFAREIYPMLFICLFVGRCLDLIPARFLGNGYLLLCNWFAFLRAKTHNSRTAPMRFRMCKACQFIKSLYGKLGPDGLEFRRGKGFRKAALQHMRKPWKS